MTDEDPLIGTYCGSNIPPVFTSTSNILYVQFYTDVSIGAAGFNATYTQLPGKIPFFKKLSPLNF
jgi:cubilin